MAVNFPDAPSNGDSFSVNDTTYVYNATAGYWDITSTVQASASTGTNAPSNPSAGDFWFDPSSLTTYIYYSDGTSSQWIPANSVGARGAPGPGYPTSYYSVDYTSTTTGNVVFNSSSTPTLPSYTVGKVNAWVNGVLRSDIDATDGSNVEISLSTGDEVQIINFGDTDVLDPTASSNDHTTYTTLSSLIDTVQSNVTSAGSGVAVYATPDLLPLTGTDAGEQAYVNSTNRLYINNGTGWYSIGLVNSSPTITSVLDGDSNTTPFTLTTDGSATVITVTASDPEQVPLTYNYSVTSGSLTNGGGTTATITQSDNVFTVTPSTTEAYAGTFELTFTASDGINTATNANSFTLSFSSWGNVTQQAKIQASDAQASDRFGKSVSISNDGNTAIVGAYLEDTTADGAGSAYIFTRSGTTWSQQAKIQASDAQAYDYFGIDVSISSDGNTAIVGAYSEDTGGNEAGAAYIFTRSGTTWSQQAKIQASDIQAIDYFGQSVSISSDGNTAIVGAYGEDTTAGEAGSAYVFTRSGTSWSQQAKIQASNAGSADIFGIAVSISGDGNTAIVGAYNEDTTATDSGAAYVFTRSGTTWSQQAMIKASDAQSGDRFGQYVSISSDGNTAIVGAWSEDTTATDAGSAYIFTRSGTTWSQEAKIQSSDVQAGDNFGQSVSISDDGNTVIVGAKNEDTTATDAGAAYVFTRSGTTWSQEAKIQSSDAQASDRFGQYVSISGDGNTAIVSASNEDTTATDAGSVYIFVPA